ncbi:MAG: hypothetical protein A2W25_00295 [candidate division Zixibacteria bacterium RBG_16_53_22]|nr:MAG: hypothetical protein A2W25_00295 [candidate division Zixibacteria bacterium RBG_16_53_22]
MQSFFGKFLQGSSSSNSRPGDPSARHDNIRIATCAIMMEVADSDDEFTPREKAIIVGALSQEFSLSASQVDELMATTRQRIDGSVDTWGFTNTLNQNLSEDERLKILETIWKIIYSDDNLSHHEDSLAHKLSYLLGLTHDQLIAAKLKVRPL